MTLEKSHLALLGLVASLAACESHGAVNKLEGRPEAYWLEMDATRRSAFVVPGRDGAPPKIFAEPAPDAMLSRVTDVVLKIAQEGGTQSGEVNASLAETAAELSQQAETVKFVRDALYRLSELSYNGVLDPKEAPGLYRSALDAATAIARAKYARAAEDTLVEIAKVQAAQRDALDRISALTVRETEDGKQLKLSEERRLLELKRQEAALMEMLRALLPGSAGIDG